MVFERLILTVPSLSVPMGSRAPVLRRPRWWRGVVGGRGRDGDRVVAPEKSRRPMAAGSYCLIQVAPEHDR
jgi:hypothetical protein